jgi:drug/metabolite transporter (DMT)-like permease
MNSTGYARPQATAPTVYDKANDMAPRASGALLFVVGTILLGTIGVFVHEAHAHPLTATWFRCAFGLLGLTAWTLLRGDIGHVRLPRSSWCWVLAAGLLMVLGWALFFAAIERTSTGVATVLFHVQPLWVLVLGAWWLKESIARQRIIAVTLAMVGLVLATGMLNSVALPAYATGAFGADYWVGVGFCLVGAFCTACVTIIARRLRNMPAGILAWWQCAIGTLVLAAWPIIHGWPASGVSWAWLSGLGLIHTGLAYALMYAGMARLSTDRVAVFQFIYPAVAIVIDWLFYGQRLGSVQMFGIALMAVAVWLAERAPRQRPGAAGRSGLAPSRDGCSSPSHLPDTNQPRTAGRAAKAGAR